MTEITADRCTTAAFRNANQFQHFNASNLQIKQQMHKHQSLYLQFVQFYTYI